MFSLMKHIYHLFDYDYQKEYYAKKFEEETQCFENVLEKEVLTEKVVEKIAEPKEDVTCIRETGVITSLRSCSATINNTIFFDAHVADKFDEYKIGCAVEYLGYKSKNSDKVRMVKVELVQDYWDTAPTEEHINDTIAILKSDDPKYFTTHQRTILGLILSRNRQFIVVDTDYKEITVDLDNVSIDFIPKEGDRVFLNCNVQTDENFVDLAGEILETISIHPARTKTGTGTVQKVHDDWGVINVDCYFTKDIYESVVEINKGDEVTAEMIECERGIFLWRCLTISVLKRTPEPQKQKMIPIKAHNHQAVNITEGIRFVLQNAFETQEQTIQIKNNCERVQKIIHIEVAGIRHNSQLRVDKSKIPIILEPGQTEEITLHCESRFYGFSKEKLSFMFVNFKVTRLIEIAVGVDEDKENIENKTGTRFRSRHYANQVWSTKIEVIPSVRNFASRRFVAHKIGSFEVPQKLRNAMLLNVSRSEQTENVVVLYPCLNQELNMENYVKRFQVLLHIEEIEQFVSFRHYDQERGHFTREGEFLALTIDNLAEKRPSLVTGDTVRATNPWADDQDNRAYDGHIYKIQFNKVLLMFNPGFQNKYNGEDYHLEFFFSRYCYRKQHYALQKIVTIRSENFLFPSRVIHSDILQLDAMLDDDNNLMIDGKVLKRQWCNPNLNKIQKLAIVNILRGEARTMPYLIFGPPGTGKTLTVVEAILQLVLNMPSCRILVATPSNSAADLIASRLIDSGVLTVGEFVRLVSQKVIDKELIPDHLKPYCATVDIAMQGSAKSSMVVTESGLKLKCQMKYLGRQKITISTCSTMGCFLQMDFPKEHFTHLLVDEAGQSTETETCVPISLLAPYSGQVILAGDPYQLGPIVLNNFAIARPLTISFLERLVSRFPYRKDKVSFPETGYDPRLVTKLIYNYRALPSILHTYNNLFYDSELVAMLETTGNPEFELLESIQSLLPKSETRPTGHATFFHGIRGENRQDSDSPSWYNPIEAKHIFLMTVQLYRLHIEPQQIGIITPYQKQVKILRNMFAEADIAMPKIGSVEEFQGQERDIILMSTVRSSIHFITQDLKYSLGFSCSPKRMNVAISRARALLFICGNPHLLSLTDQWCKFISFCVENDAYIGCDLPEKIANNINMQAQS